ncbi:MAG TPA: hypothetical protein VIJ61_15490, partial [Thermoanaerobaculia bacterium]
SRASQYAPLVTPCRKRPPGLLSESGNRSPHKVSFFPEDVKAGGTPADSQGRGDHPRRFWREIAEEEPVEGKKKPTSKKKTVCPLAPNKAAWD